METLTVAAAFLKGDFHPFGEISSVFYFVQEMLRGTPKILIAAQVPNQTSVSSQ